MQFLEYVCSTVIFYKLDYSKTSRDTEWLSYTGPRMILANITNAVNRRTKTGCSRNPLSFLRCSISYRRLPEACFLNLYVSCADEATASGAEYIKIAAIREGAAFYNKEP